MSLTVAHVSDTHFGGPADARTRSDRILDHLLAMYPRPDVLLVSGDVADHGRPEEYDEACAVLDRWTGPRVVGIGNHDVREPFVAAFGPPVATLEVGTARIHTLDSLVDAVDGVRQDHGQLPADQLTWLDEQLAEDDRPSFVCLHHPPVDIGLEVMAPILLRDPERLERVIERHDHVVATLVGHAHTQAATTFAGKPLLIGGGVASTVTIDAEPLPRIWEAGPPTFALHQLDDDGRLTTHWRAL